MEFYEVIEARRSIRHYKSDPIPEETILRILNAARLAPSWKNSQNWHFILVQDTANKTALLNAFADTNPGKKALAAAPVVVILCANPDNSGKMGDKEYYLVDAAIAMEHLILAARAEELGTCWMGLFDENVIQKALEIPSPWRVIGITPLGYPDQDPKPRPRKALEEMISWEKWVQTKV